MKIRSAKQQSIVEGNTNSMNEMLNTDTTSIESVTVSVETHSLLDKKQRRNDLMLTLAHNPATFTQSSYCKLM